MPITVPMVTITGSMFHSSAMTEKEAVMMLEENLIIGCLIRDGYESELKYCIE